MQTIKEWEKSKKDGARGFALTQIALVEGYGCGIYPESVGALTVVIDKKAALYWLGKLPDSIKTEEEKAAAVKVAEAVRDHWESTLQDEEDSYSETIDMSTYGHPLRAETVQRLEADYKHRDEINRLIILLKALTTGS